MRVRIVSALIMVLDLVSHATLAKFFSAMSMTYDATSVIPNLIVRNGGEEIAVPADEDGGGAVVELLRGEPRVVEGQVAATEYGVNAVS